jgi:hypothetical protein
MPVLARGLRPGRRPFEWTRRAGRPPSPPRTSPDPPAGGVTTSWGRTTQCAASGIRNSRPPGIDRQRPGAAPATLCEMLRRSLVRRGTDHRGQLGLDQHLVDRLRSLADSITDIAGLDCVENLEQGRLIQGHRVAMRTPVGSRRDSRDDPSQLARHAGQALDLHRSPGTSPCGFAGGHGVLCASQHGASQHGASQHSASQHSASQHSASQHSASQHSASQHSPRGAVSPHTGRCFHAVGVSLVVISASRRLGGGLAELASSGTAGL